MFLFTCCSTRVSLWLIPCFPELSWSAKQRNLSKDADKSEASENNKSVHKKIAAARAVLVAISNRPRRNDGNSAQKEGESMGSLSRARRVSMNIL